MDADKPVVPEDREFSPNAKYTKTYIAGNGDKIVVEVEDSMRKFAWRLTVNDDVGQVYSYYQGICCHKDWCVATMYWSGTFIEFHPFKAEYAKELSK